MGNCKEHKKDVEGITNMKQLAEAIGDLHYETLAEFLHELQRKVHDDAMKDLGGERFKLFHILHRASTHLFNASQEILSAWKISKKHMNEST